MGKIKGLVLLAVLGLTVFLSWQVGATEWANAEFQTDLHNLAGNGSISIGHYTPWTDDQFRDAILRKAKDEGIVLQPEQVIIQHPDSGPNATVYLEADYTKQISLPGYSFVMHFAPSSTKSGTF
ncbi:MAG: hypothetical protein ACRD3E_02905 [Terriglobales bacterium]